MILTRGAELALVNGFYQVTASPEPSPLGTLEELERAHILKVLEATAWRVSGAYTFREPLPRRTGF